MNKSDTRTGKLFLKESKKKNKINDYGQITCSFFSYYHLDSCTTKVVSRTKFDRNFFNNTQYNNGNRVTSSRKSKFIILKNKNCKFVLENIMKFNIDGNYWGKRKKNSFQKQEFIFNIHYRKAKIKNIEPLKQKRNYSMYNRTFL